MVGGMATESAEERRDQGIRFSMQNLPVVARYYYGGRRDPPVAGMMVGARLLSLVDSGFPRAPFFPHRAGDRDSQGGVEKARSLQRTASA